MALCLCGGPHISASSPNAAIDLDGKPFDPFRAENLQQLSRNPSPR